MMVARRGTGGWQIAIPNRPAGLLGAQRTAAASGSLLNSATRNLLFGVVYMLCVMLAAVGCYVAAGWSLGDALYMVVITVYTVGFAEVMPVDTPLLRTITILTIVLGCTGMIFLTGAIVQAITLNQLNQILGTKRMTTQLDRLRDHVIVCGFGRTGAMLAQELQAGGVPVLVIEEAEADAAAARELGYLCLQADATSETTLLDAGVGRARALTAVVSNDAANVFITLSARSLNPTLEIIARGEVPSTESKLLQAGANRVVLPAHTGAERIAEMILYRETARFIHDTERMREFEKVLRSLDLEVEIVVAAPNSTVVGQTIDALERRADGAFFVVQIDHGAGDPVMRPPGSAVIGPGDGLVLLGRGAKMRAMRALFETGGRSPFRFSAR